MQRRAFVTVLGLTQAAFFGLTAYSVHDQTNRDRVHRKITFPRVQYAIFLALNVAYPLVCKKVLTALHCEKDEAGNWRMASGPAFSKTVFPDGERVGRVVQVRLIEEGPMTYNAWPIGSVKAGRQAASGL